MQCANHMVHQACPQEHFDAGMLDVDQFQAATPPCCLLTKKSLNSLNAGSTPQFLVSGYWDSHQPAL